MKCEKPEFELARLRDQQTKTREDEVFGGLTRAERSAYEQRQDRINELEITLSDRGGVRRRSRDSSWSND